MGLTEQLAENISGYSKAKYSTWLFYKPDRLLFDAGEGVSTSLGNYIYGVEQIFISHGHFDHIGGIPGILRSRLSSRGDKEWARALVGNGERGFKLRKAEGWLATRRKTHPEEVAHAKP